MPHSTLIARELADFLGVLSHPHRVRIVEELRVGERGVNQLQEVLQISHSGVSQHLAMLRAHRVVAERREGRHVYYRLVQPALAGWLVDGMAFLATLADEAETLREAIGQVREEWAPLPARRKARKA